MEQPTQDTDLLAWLPSLGFVVNDPAAQVKLEIAALALLDDDWDGADALAISAGAVSAAQELIAVMALSAYLNGMAWRNPDVSPTPQGGIYLHWDIKSLQFSVIIAPDSAEVALLVGTGKGRARRFTLTVAEAAVYAAALLPRQIVQEGVSSRSNYSK